ncbi:MAG TPA: hypothetical protein DDZ51_05840 [Planctomycetaceae bacterium]|nr:hypothetical protein [Planctomycetaceae bacterium]
MHKNVLTSPGPSKLSDINTTATTRASGNGTNRASSMVSQNTDLATAIADHSPIPACRCEACDAATRRADLQRFAILNIVAAFESIEGLMQELTAETYVAENAGRAGR